jgi:hypothetical protein
MPMFEIRPIDRSGVLAAIIAPDPAHVLHIIAGLECKEADVFRDGEYRMTIRLGENGNWSIFERDYSIEKGTSAGRLL